VSYLDLLGLGFGRHGSLDNIMDEANKRHTLPPEQIPPDSSPSKDLKDKRTVSLKLLFLRYKITYYNKMAVLFQQEL